MKNNKKTKFKPFVRLICKPLNWCTKDNNIIYSVLSCNLIAGACWAIDVIFPNPVLHIILVTIVDITFIFWITMFLKGLYTAVYCTITKKGLYDFPFFEEQTEGESQKSEPSCTRDYDR